MLKILGEKVINPAAAIVFESINLMKYVCKYSFGIHSHFSGKNPVSGSQAYRDPISTWELIDRDPALTSNGDLDSYPNWQTGMGS